MKKLRHLCLWVLFIIATVSVWSAETPALSEQENDVKYEIGAIRVLVHEEVKREADKAKIFIDDVEKGVSPVFIQDLKPGSYKVRVEGRRSSWSGAVDIESGKTSGVDVTLQNREASAELYEILLWEDFLDNRNDWSLKPGSLIDNGRLIAKTNNFLEYFLARHHTFKDFSMEATFRVKQETSNASGFSGAGAKLPGSTFGFVFRVNGSAVVLLFESSGGRISEYYLINFEDITYYSQPIVVGGQLKARIKERFRVKTILKYDELQIFIDGQLVGIAQVKYTNEGNIGLALGPGLRVEVENLTIGRI